MAGPQIPVTASVISWARERAGYSLTEAEAKFKKIAAWENPDDGTYPTYAQLELMAEAFKVPVAVFFFPSPPDAPSIKQTFRTLPETSLENLGHRVLLLLRKAKAFQISLGELTGGRNPAPRLITRDLRFPLDMAVGEMALAVRDYLGVTLEDQTQWADDEEALKQWRDAFHKVGVYVFKDAFRADEFAGFCLTDPEFPIIYVNNTARPFARQIFTLFHELGHLLFQTSGIDFRSAEAPSLSTSEARRIETICNSFAGSLLVPDVAFRTLMRGKNADLETARTLAEHFNVSTLLIYRKFKDHGLIDATAYRAAHKASESREVREGGGGNYYANKLAYLGRDFIGLALSAYHKQRITEAQLAEHLNLPVKQLSTLEERYLRGAAA